jgi:hypothetical protein
LRQVKGQRNGLTENLKTVILVYLNFFVHNNMNEIIEGNYIILEKVVMKKRIA